MGGDAGRRASGWVGAPVGSGGAAAGRRVAGWVRASRLAGRSAQPVGWSSCSARKAAITRRTLGLLQVRAVARAGEDVLADVGDALDEGLPGGGGRLVVLAGDDEGRGDHAVETVDDGPVAHRCR